MNQRGSIVFDLIMAAGAAIVLGGAVLGIKHWWHQTVYVPAFNDGAAKQRAEDQPVITKANAERDAAVTDRDTARGNSDRCEAAQKEQASARAESDRRTAANLAASRAQAEQNRRLAAALAPQIVGLQTKARDKETKLLGCQDELDVTATELRATAKEQLKARGGAK